VLPYTDLFLYDIKLIDDKEHMSYTEQSNKVILDNYKYLAEKISGTDKKIWIRTPIIPGATDTDSNIKGIAEFIGDMPERWELCAFNILCRDKYKRLYLEWDYAGAGLMSRERMDELVSVAHSAGASQAVWTGAVAITDR
jgi:pyruvate formate lyase activating enzyme